MDKVFCSNKYGFQQQDHEKQHSNDYIPVFLLLALSLKHEGWVYRGKEACVCLGRHHSPCSLSLGNSKPNGKTAGEKRTSDGVDKGGGRRRRVTETEWTGIHSMKRFSGVVWNPGMFPSPART